MKITVFFDGGCHLGVDAAGAAVAFDDDGRELDRKATYLDGPMSTTNIGEYQGLANALALIARLKPDIAVVLGDSELIIRQVDGRYACRKEHLKPWHARCLEMIEELRQAGIAVSVRELPKSGPKRKRRFANVAADALATECMQVGRDLP